MRVNGYGSRGSKQRKVDVHDGKIPNHARMLQNVVNSFKFYVCYTTIGGGDSSKREIVSDNIANSFRRTFSQYKSETLCTNSSPRMRDSFYEYRI